MFPTFWCIIAFYTQCRLWRKAYIPNVWDRMLADAAARHEARLNASSYVEGANADFNPKALSG